jgi:hypothetical protein
MKRRARLVKRNARRNAEIVEAVDQGAKPTDVARQYSLSRERVRQIVSAARRRARNPYWLLGVRIHNALATHFNDDFGRDPERDSASVRGMSEAQLLAIKNIGPRALLVIAQWLATEHATSHESPKKDSPFA